MNSCKKILENADIKKFIEIDDLKKNIIITNVINFLNEENIIFSNEENIDISKEFNLCYQLNSFEISIAIDILNEYHSDLILVKILYNLDLSIYIYMKYNKIFVINMRLSTNKIIGIIIDRSYN